MDNLEILGLRRVDDTKGVNRICISKKDRQHNDQKKKDQQRSQNTAQKTKD